MVSQLRKLLEIQSEIPQLEKDQEFQYLLETIRGFRDEELEHLETAVEQDAHEAPMYQLLTKAIQSGCKLAIKIAEKI
jgi:ubiquinone biosynthesis monooxygenase Coq7